VSSLKSDCSLLSRLYIACQSGEGKLDDFFCHEDQVCPPSISQLGKLRMGTKSDLLRCLESCTEFKGDAPDTDVTIIDGAVVVAMRGRVSGISPRRLRHHGSSSASLPCPALHSAAPLHCLSLCYDSVH